MALSRQLTVWMRAAKPSQSYGALPRELQVFVSSFGLTALRAMVPKEFGSRVACIKRREQNQRALDTRKAAKGKELEELRRQVHVLEAHCRLLSAYTRAMTEYAGHRITAEPDNLFSPGAQAMHLFRDVHARRPCDTQRVGPKRRRRCREQSGAGCERHAADAESEFVGGFVHLDDALGSFLQEGSEQGGDSGGAAVGERQVLVGAVGR